MKEISLDDMPESDLTQEEWDEWQGYNSPTLIDKSELMEKYNNKEITLYELYMLNKQKKLSREDLDEFLTIAIEDTLKRGIFV